MMTKLSGCHTGFCAGDGVHSQFHFGNPHCFDGHAYVKVYTPYTDLPPLHETWLYKLI